jgi:hypothetical protein
MHGQGAHLSHPTEVFFTSNPRHHTLSSSLQLELEAAPIGEKLEATPTGVRVHKANLLKSLARPTGIEPVFPP